jgi:hypothetical protein
MIYGDILNYIPDFLRIKRFSGSASTRNSRSLRYIVLEDLPDCTITKLIIPLRLLEAQFSEFVELGYGFFMFGFDLLP